MVSLMGNRLQTSDHATLGLAASKPLEHVSSIRRRASRSSVPNEPIPHWAPNGNSPSNSTIDVDPDGDLILIVGEFEEDAGGVKQLDEPRPRMFKVCPKTVSRSSSRLKTILSTDSRTIIHMMGESWMVHLPQDKPKPMSTLLRIMHGYFDQVPSGSKKSYADIYDIAVLADKYDLAHLLRPWATQWIERLGNRLEDSDVNDIECLERRSWIAWVLGGKDLFCRSLYGLAIRLSGDPLFKSPNGSVQLKPLFREIHEPPGATNAVAALRLEILGAMFQPFKESENAIVSEKKCMPPGGFGCTQHTSRCNDAMLVSTMRGLASCNMWPLPQPTQIMTSAYAIERKLRTLRIVAYKNHVKCRQFLEEFLRNRWPTKGHSLIITDLQRKHLEAQAMKTGFENNAAASQHR